MTLREFIIATSYALILFVAIFLVCKSIESFMPPESLIIKSATLVERSYGIERCNIEHYLTIWDVEDIGFVACDDEEIFRRSKEKVMLKLSLGRGGPCIRGIVS